MKTLRDAACALAFGLAAGCASLPSPPPQFAGSGGPAEFDITGRLSARRGSDGVAANFSWSHTGSDDRLDVVTPLGQTLARLTGDASGVRLERPGEPVVAYADWDALTRAVFGVAIPVNGLAHWVVGAADPGAAYGIERDSSGRPSVLRQQGWEIVYSFADGAPASRPARLVMRFPDIETVEIRVVVDRWSAPDARS